MTYKKANDNTSNKTIKQREKRGLTILSDEDIRRLSEENYRRAFRSIANKRIGALKVDPKEEIKKTYEYYDRIMSQEGKDIDKTVDYLKNLKNDLKKSSY
jgi:hypothetical protein